MSQENEVEFRWMLSHLGFAINELADKAADTSPIGPFPFPHPTIASRIRANKALAVHKWCDSWAPFAAAKALVLKKKKKILLPNAWDGKDKLFMQRAGDMVPLQGLCRAMCPQENSNSISSLRNHKDAHALQDISHIRTCSWSDLSIFLNLLLWLPFTMQITTLTR